MIVAEGRGLTLSRDEIRVKSRTGIDSTMVAIELNLLETELKLVTGLKRDGLVD